MAKRGDANMRQQQSGQVIPDEIKQIVSTGDYALLVQRAEEWGRDWNGRG